VNSNFEIPEGLLLFRVYYGNNFTIPVARVFGVGFAGGSSIQCGLLLYATGMWFKFSLLSQQRDDSTLHCDGIIQRNYLK
jgi:hypothetical protein